MTTADALLPFWDDRLPGARATMFCLPHSGGGASAYREWVRASTTLDVQPVQLPGREQLIDTPGIESMPELASLIGGLMVERAPQRFVLFGHSMGGAIAAEVAAWLERGGHSVPALLVVSARPPVNQARPGPGESEDEWLLRRVLAMGGTPAEVLEEPELRELILGTFRADTRLLQDYVPRFGRLSLPLLALGGTEDDVTESRLAAWQDHFTAPIRIRMYPGGHFYLRRHRDAVLAAVEEALTDTPAGKETLHDA
ncbi:thioesterase II family protein [Streptomyces spectabilis]|uniref:Thioesterase n=1 Tax=Streptomyces spectabilis TaxID=68270 RepID=A0A5P2XK26_STRST|nr:alpha/beta fold hydrolase [Streptomyces spectabilis]MBB5105421.1 surfactin synthase thioesterase subunit [Streptomyces spectabilis]MCI3906613.1 alpha/beta fold hydrolase [Streptomyces spectabilis]QEV63435.1 thioesterase [Streptomyces spectabilis]GGV21473.1 thioesterase [Streptomyces spectabilis]